MAELKDLSVSFLSLVKSPATGKGLTLKAADGQRATAFDLIIKNDDMQRAYGIVYSPNQEDAHGDTASADTIRRAAAEFMREGRLKNIDTEHSFTNEMAFVAENWLVRKGDALFPNEPEGSWAVGIQIGDVDLWKQLKSGELTGISLAGIARMDPEPNDRGNSYYTEKDEAPGWFKSFFTKNKSTNEETEMDKKEVQDIVRETLKSEMGDALKVALKAAGIGGTIPEDKSTEIEKAVAAALKAAGVEANPEGGDGDETEIEKAVAKALAPLMDGLDDKITKAMAKGVTETDPNAGGTEESFV